MKIKLISLCILFLLRLTLCAQQSSFTCIEDAYVSNSAPNANYGSETTLLVKGSTSGNFDRKSYLKYDLTGSSGNYAQIVLKLVKSGGENVKLDVNSTGTSWDENTLNWNNTPANSKNVNQGYTTIGDTMFIDVTDYIKSKIINSQFTVSFSLSTSDIIGNPYSIFSKETPLSITRAKLVFYKTAKFAAIKDISLTNYISSNMVIQRGQPFPFRGEGEPGKTINVDFNRKGTHYTASGVIDANGKFSVLIPSMQQTTQGCTAVISINGFPEKNITLTNILIGDVWYAGGQSNMEKRVNYMLDSTQVIADADNYPNIRAFRSAYNAVFDPIDKVKTGNASWFVCNSANVELASAVAYTFAKRLNIETGVPIGLMLTPVGGTEIETWLSEDKIRNDSKLQFIENRIPSYDKTDPKYYQTYPSVNYNGMVNPLRFFPISGFIYYQGESNVSSAPEYSLLLEALIEDYRQKWKLGDLPFYYVQLANYGIATDRNYESTPNDNTWQMLRQQQLNTLQKSGLPNINMAIIIETNEEHLNPMQNIRIHPHNKKPVGERLAKIALKEQYGQNINAYSSFVEKVWVQGSKVFLQFNNTYLGLKIRTGESKLTGFAVGNSQGTFHTATAKIESPNVVSVYSPLISTPFIVSYGWSKDPLCTLDNSENLPASPFKLNINDILTTAKEIYDESTSIVVHPNPVKNGVLKISSQDFIDNQEIKIRLTAITGQEATCQFLKNNYEIDVSNLKAGLYFLIIEYNDVRVRKKMIIE